MKISVVILLSAIMLCLSGKDMITYAHYVWNNDYIVENYCVNKAEPELLCSGKCYLETSLLDNHEEDGNMSDNRQELKTTSLFYTLVNEINLKNRIATPSKKKMLVAERDFYSYTYNDRLFHPPRMS